MAEAGVDEVTAALALGAGFANSLTAAAVRLGVIGATAAQQVLAELQPELAHLAAEGRARPLDDLGGYLPIVDVMGLRQRSLAGRVFAS